MEALEVTAKRWMRSFDAPDRFLGTSGPLASTGGIGSTNGRKHHGDEQAVAELVERLGIAARRPS
jgi:hypothetical protein